MTRTVYGRGISVTGVLVHYNDETCEVTAVPVCHEEMSVGHVLGSDLVECAVCHQQYCCPKVFEEDGTARWKISWQMKMEESLVDLSSLVLEQWATDWMGLADGDVKVVIT